MYVEVEVPDMMAVFHNPTAKVDDLIFRTRHVKYRGVGDVANINTDKDWKNPDRALYVFSNMAVNELSVIHSNNMVTGVRTKFGLQSTELHNNIISRTQKSSAYTSCTGLYVVETYTIYNDGSANLDRILKHYMYSNGIEYPPETLSNILEMLHKKIVVDKFNPEIEIRIVTFVPESEVKRLGYMYIPSTNIVIAQGDITNVAHPHSKVYRDSGKYDEHELSKATINIEIVDNNVVPYYIKLGESVVKLFSNKKGEQAQGGYVEISRGGNVIENSVIKLEDLHKIGLFRTEEEAKANGDLKAEVELKKLALEKDKLAADYAKLDYEHKKLITDYEHQRMKIEAETSHIKAKHNIEIDNITTKHRLDVSKKQNDAAIDIIKAELDMSQTHHKHLTSLYMDNAKFATDVAKSKIDLISSVQLANIKREETYEKYRREIRKDQFGLIKDVTGLASNMIAIGKLFI